MDYVAWYNLQGDSLNRDDVSLAQLEQVTVASAGEVRKEGWRQHRIHPAADHLAETMVVDAARVRQEPNPVRLLAISAAEYRHVLAARVRGELTSAFPGGPPAAAEGQERPADFPAHPRPQPGRGEYRRRQRHRILEDRFWVRVQDFFGQQVATPFSGNGPFVANLADTLSGSTR